MKRYRSHKRNKLFKSCKEEEGFEVNQSREAPELLQYNYTLVAALNIRVTCTLRPFIEARCSK